MCPSFGRHLGPLPLFRGLPLGTSGIEMHVCVDTHLFEMLVKGQLCSLWPLCLSLQGLLSAVLLTVRHLRIDPVNNALRLSDAAPALPCSHTDQNYSHVTSSVDGGGVGMACVDPSCTFLFRLARALKQWKNQLACELCVTGLGT